MLIGGLLLKGLKVTLGVEELILGFIQLNLKFSHDLIVFCLQILVERVRLSLEEFDLILPLLVFVIHFLYLFLQKHHFLFEQCIVSFLIALHSKKFVVQFINKLFLFVNLTLEYLGFLSIDMLQR